LAKYNGTFEIAKFIRIQFDNLHDVDTLEPVISKT